MGEIKAGVDTNGKHPGQREEWELQENGGNNWGDVLE